MILKNRFVTIKKPHECDECGNTTISDGANRMRNVSLFEEDGKFRCFYFCELCWDFVRNAYPWLAYEESGRTRHDPKAEVDAFNAKTPVGSEVEYCTVAGFDPKYTRKSKTRTPAEVLSGHTAVVWLEGVAGCWNCDMVRGTTQVL